MSQSLDQLISHALDMFFIWALSMESAPHPSSCNQAIFQIFGHSQLYCPPESWGKDMLEHGTVTVLIMLPCRGFYEAQAYFDNPTITGFGVHIFHTRWVSCTPYCCMYHLPSSKCTHRLYSLGNCSVTCIWVPAYSCVILQKLKKKHCLTQPCAWLNSCPDCYISGKGFALR